MYQYWGFGLHIESEIEFPEFLPSRFKDADVRISIGDTPEELPGDEVIHLVRVSISPTEYLLKVARVADYYVSNGNEIRIRPHTGADAKSIRLFTLSNAVAAILHQRNTIPLHASAVCYQDGLILFCGDSGVGKSTLIVALRQKGYNVFSDEVCVLKPAEDTSQSVMVLPSSPIITLWEDSFEKIGLAMAGDDARLRPDLAKYAHFYHDEFDTSPRLVKKVFVLDARSHDHEPQIRRLGSLEAFQTLQRTTYRQVQRDAMQKRDFHFTILSKLIASVPVYQISRSQHDNTLDKMVNLIETTLTKHA